MIAKSRSRRRRRGGTRGSGAAAAGERCIQLLVNGQRCRNFALEDSNFCAVHRPGQRIKRRMLEKA